MNKKLITFTGLGLIAVFGVAIYFYRLESNTALMLNDQTNELNLLNQGGEAGSIDNLLSIEALRKGDYPGSEILIEQTLSPGSNYQRYIVSYKSEGLKIYALLTIPDFQKPPIGWPVIIFNHGYIPPKEYKTAERYVAYIDGFASNGYIVFKPDYRGYGNSQGLATGGYGSNAYTIDVLNALASIKKLKDPLSDSSSSPHTGQTADPNRIGIWGHSMGGYISLRTMVVTKDIKAGVIWAGVVASYSDLLTSWRRRTTTPPPSIPSSGRRWRDQLTEKYGTPEQNPTFWNSISANSYLADISGPLQLHHGTADTSVPVEFSEKLMDQLDKTRKMVELYIYSGDDHNISANFNTAMERSIDFFDKYLKEKK